MQDLELVNFITQVRGILLIIITFEKFIENCFDPKLWTTDRGEICEPNELRTKDGWLVNIDFGWDKPKKSIQIKRLKKAGANKEDLIDVYTKQVRSVLEFGVPVWNSGLS